MSPASVAPLFAAWSGFDSPLRRRGAIGARHFDDHQIWWLVEAESARAALDQLPWYIAIRTRVVRVREVAIP